MIANVLEISMDDVAFIDSVINDNVVYMVRDKEEDYFLAIDEYPTSYEIIEVVKGYK